MLMMSTKRKTTTTLPDRTAILSYMNQRRQPLTEAALFRAFTVKRAEDKQRVRSLLGEMEREGVVIKNRKDRYALPSHMDMVHGRVSGHADGYGFLVPDQGGPDLYLSPREMRNVLHGDRVVGRVTRVDRRGRLEGTIVAVTERTNKTIVGRYVVEKGVGFVVPDDQRISQDVFIPPEEAGDARGHQIVVAEVTRQPNKRFQPVGRIVNVLGEHLAPGMEIEISIHKYGLPHRWPAAVTAETERMAGPVDTGQREDIRDLPLVTIDGEDARDFDDAVYCERRGDAWRLVVAIADVSHYVAPGTALDQAARERGTSVYFPERVIPMLPERLSNDLCSLNPDVDRYCFACEVEIERDGSLGEYRFFEAVMRSRARLTYTEVAAIIGGGNPAATAERRDLVKYLQALHELAVRLRKRRARDGTVDFELPETRIVFDANRKISRIEPVERNDAHRLIEECMLAANVCAADVMQRHQAPGIYRVHERPDPLKIEDVRKFVAEFGLTLAGGGNPQPLDFAELIDRCAGAVHSHIVQTALLRSMKQAVYTVHNSGHFALGFDRYAHFTSPIRRYPDLHNHRVIKQLKPAAATDQSIQGPDAQLERLAQHCSMTERRADEATRDVVQWLKAEFMLDRIGEEFPGVVSAVVDFGIFVELEQLYVEGLVHITEMGNDYFHFDPTRRRLTGERSGARFQLGDRVKVKVSRVDLDDAKIDFMLVDSGVTARRRGRRR